MVKRQRARNSFLLGGTTPHPLNAEKKSARTPRRRRKKKFSLPKKKGSGKHAGKGLTAQREKKKRVLQKVSGGPYIFPRGGVKLGSEKKERGIVVTEEAPLLELGKEGGKGGLLARSKKKKRKGDVSLRIEDVHELRGRGKGV